MSFGFYLKILMDLSDRIQLTISTIISWGLLLGAGISLYEQQWFNAFFSLAIGTLWEVFEFLTDSIFGLHMQSGPFITDTMVDLMLDASGGLIIACIGYFYVKKVPVPLKESSDLSSYQTLEGKEADEKTRCVNFLHIRRSLIS